MSGPACYRLLAGYAKPLAAIKIIQCVCVSAAVLVPALALVIIIIIDNRGFNARWCLTPLLLSLPTAAYLGQRGLTPAGLPHTTAQCHLTILGEAVLFCLNHPALVHCCNTLAVATLG